LKKKGLNNAQIAREIGSNRTSIGQYLASLKQDKQQLTDFESYSVPSWQRIKSLSHTAKAKLLESMVMGDYLPSLSPDQKQRHLTALNIVAGTAEDKVRLLTGQSTNNVSLINQHYIRSSTHKPTNVNVHEHIERLPRRMSGSPLRQVNTGGQGGNDGET